MKKLMTIFVFMFLSTAVFSQHFGNVSCDECIEKPDGSAWRWCYDMDTGYQWEEWCYFTGPGDGGGGDGGEPKPIEDPGPGQNIFSYTSVTEFFRKMFNF